MTGGTQPRKNCTAKQEVIETMAEFMLKYVMPSTPHTVNESSAEIQAGTFKAPVTETTQDSDDMGLR